MNEPYTFNGSINELTDELTALVTTRIREAMHKGNFETYESIQEAVLHFLYKRQLKP